MSEVDGNCAVPYRSSMQSETSSSSKIMDVNMYPNGLYSGLSHNFESLFLL